MAVLRTGWCQSTNEMQWMDKEERWHLFFPRIFQRSIFLLLQSPTPTSSTGLLHQSHCHSSHDRISHKTFERFDRLTFSNCAGIDSRCQPPFLFIHIFEAIGEKWGGKKLYSCCCGNISPSLKCKWRRRHTFTIQLKRHFRRLSKSILIISMNI